MSGRLPSLKDSGASKPLKFKPKAVARRTKEEREASVPKLKPDEVEVDKNRRKRAPPTANKKRVPKYLNNTHVISSGPMAAGTYSSNSGSMNRGFGSPIIKTDEETSSLIQKSLESLENGNGDDEDEDMEGQRTRARKLNMGKELSYKQYILHEKEIEDDDNEDDVDLTTAEGEATEELETRRIEQLFPVRPLRVRHEDTETLHKTIQETYSEIATREATPAPQSVTQIKEDPEHANSLQDVLVKKENELQNKLEELYIENGVDGQSRELNLEKIQIQNDYIKILKNIEKINDKPNKFMVFQLPPKLPEFKVKPSKREANIEQAPTSIDDKSNADDKPGKKAKQQEPEPELNGKIGSLRIHKSGKLTIKIGDVVMDISRGAETTFIQDIVKINEHEDANQDKDPEEQLPPSIECLGTVTGRAVVQPSI